MPLLPLSKFHFATRLELHKWSTLSRNEIGPFLARFGIAPLGTKFPMMRVYVHLLGLEPATAAEEEMLGQGFVRISTVAERFGTTSDHLLSRLRAPGNSYPPLYAFGPNRHVMLRAQIEQMLSSPKNAWDSLKPIKGHAVAASCLARNLNVPQSRIDTLLKVKRDLPARILMQGRVRYIIADVTNSLASSCSNLVTVTDGATQSAEPQHSTSKASPIFARNSDGGLFSNAADHATRQASAGRICTGSGANAHGGDCTHGSPVEAKLSET